MGYIKRHLYTEEKLLICKNPHLVTFIQPLFLMSLATVLGALVLLIIGDYNKTFVLSILIFAVLVLLIIYIKHICTEYAVTNKRVVLKTGFLSIKVNEIKKDKLENITVKYSIMGRILGYGDMSFTGTGGSPVVFHKVGNPKFVKKKIESGSDF